MTFPGRLEHRDLLTDILDDALRTRTTDDWLDLCRGRVPAAPVLTPRDALANPFMAEQELIQTLSHQSGAQFRVMAQPINTGDTRTADTGAPLLGEHTDDVLASVGYEPAEIVDLKQRGVV